MHGFELSKSFNDFFRLIREPLLDRFFLNSKILWPGFIEAGERRPTTLSFRGVRTSYKRVEKCSYQTVRILTMYQTCHETYQLEICSLNFHFVIGQLAEHRKEMYGAKIKLMGRVTSLITCNYFRYK